MEVIGYKYTDEQDAINAREQIDAYYGIPVNPSDTTQNWIDYQEANLDIPIFWYIKFHESIEPILGQPITFEVIMQTPN